MLQVNFFARTTTEEDYPELCEWWKFWKFRSPGQEMLPDNGKCGIMIHDTQDYNKNYCAGFLYFTNSKIAWFEFLISNPNIKNKELRKESIQFLLNSVAFVAKSKGFKVIFTSVKHPSLINHYKEAGWVVGSDGTKEMVLSL